MKKVINITLGSIVFAIEQESYDALASYLEQIKNNLTESDDAKEIIGDIESAIAEKFIARKRGEKNAVTLTDVQEVITEMGNPAEFGEVKDDVSREGEDESRKDGSELKKRLYRDADNAVIAGVASGLARYFNIDPVIVRLIFVISVFFNGLGIIAYVILWVVVPVAATTAEKYAMRGERVTLKDISERVKKNIESIEKADYSTTKSIWSKLRRVLDKLFRSLGLIVRLVIMFARYMTGLALVIGGALGIAAMVSAYSVILLSQKVFFPYEVQVALETMQSSTLGIVAIVSSFVMMATFLIVLIIAGAGLLAKHNFFTVQKSVIFVVVWIVAAVLAGTTSVLQFEQVMQKIEPGEGHIIYSGFKENWKKDVMFMSNANTFYTDDGQYFTIKYYDDSERARLSFGQSQYNLVRAMSGSGARYISDDESVEFWEHQGEATLTIGEEIFTAKLSQPIGVIDLPNSYENEEFGYSINYPKNWTVDTSYKYDQLGPEEPTISGVKFYIPESMSNDTNLSSFDTGVSIEVMSDMPTCTAYPFLIQPESVTATTSNGVEYSLGTMTGAGAGNLYEEFVYAVSGTDPCIAVRYYIHSTQIENYEPGTHTEYDRQNLIKVFDEIRSSLVIER